MTADLSSLSAPNSAIAVIARNKYMSIPFNDHTAHILRLLQLQSNLLRVLTSRLRERLPAGLPSADDRPQPPTRWSGLQYLGEALCKIMGQAGQTVDLEIHDCSSLDGQYSEFITFPPSLRHEISGSLITHITVVAIEHLTPLHSLVWSAKNVINSDWERLRDGIESIMLCSLPNHESQQRIVIR